MTDGKAGRSSRFVRQTGRLAVSGVLGAVIVDAARGRVGRDGARRGAVTATRWALRGKRRAEVGAENVRLTAGDIVAEARAGLGEQAPPPAAGAAAHQHDH